MNFASLSSLVVSILQLGLGLVLLLVGRAPRWRRAFTFGLATLCSAGYSFSNTIIAVPGMPEGWLRASAHMGYFFSAMFAATWAALVFSGDGRWTSLPRWVRPPILLAAASAVLGGTVAPQLTDDFVSYVLPSLVGAYRFVRPNALSYAMMGLTGLLVVGSSVELLRRRWVSGDRNPGYLVGFSAFVATVGVEAFIAAGKLEFVFVSHFGFLAALVPLAVELLDGFVRDARLLGEETTELAATVQQRTQERDEAQDAWLRAESTAALGRLAAGVGHEINNPLAYLRLNIELIGEWGREHQAPAEIMESVDSALDGADRIRRVIDALRTYSRPGTGQLTPLALEAVTQAALRVAGHQVRQVGAVETAFEPAPVVLGEEPKLVQVVVNILLNSAQALAEQRGTRPGRIVVRVRALPNDRAALEVEDNGPGISREDLRRLTQPYFTTRSAVGAMGLGLFLARSVVEQHRGLLEIESTPGTGTIVRVVLPAASAPGEADAEPAPRAGVTR